MTESPFKPLGGDVGKKESTNSGQAAKWVPIMPVPDEASTPSEAHYKHGKPSRVHKYKDAQGRLLGFVCRFDSGQGGKFFCPLTYCCHSETGEKSWRWKAWGPLRPLYGLDKLAARPGAPVVICEGEKATDACAKLMPDYVVVTSPNGSKAASKADWTPLSRRKLIIWPDADGPGWRYALDVAVAMMKIDGTETVLEIIKPPQDKPQGWDAADALSEGINEAGVRGLCMKVVPAVEALQKAYSSTASTPSFPVDTDPTGGGGKSESGGRRGAKLRKSLLELVGDCEFWHDSDRRAFATVLIDKHFENMCIDSQEFSIWFSGQCYKHLKEPVGEQAMRDVFNVLKSKAIHDGPCYETFLRIGGRDGRIYLDLGQPDWNLVCVTLDDWQIIEGENCPLKAIRTGHMQALPTPEAGELLEGLLRPFVNVENERDFRLIVAWLVCAFRDVGEYPILSINGEQGSAKSTLAKLIRLLIDPNKATNRAAPREERDLIVAAYNSRVISLDNLSGVPLWLSDALCRMATGGGFSTRALHTDMDEVVVELENPIILNGIPEIAGRPDLADRSIMISLPAISGENRKSKSEFWTEFEEQRPFILGALLDAVSSALRNLPNIKLDKKPRMANAAEWVSAAEAGLGWEAGTHIADMRANRLKIIEASLENEPVAIGIMEMDLPWCGTPSRLHEILLDKVRGGIPKTVNGMGSAITRIKPVMFEGGISIKRLPRGKQRMYSIEQIFDD